MADRRSSFEQHQGADKGPPAPLATTADPVGSTSLFERARFGFDANGIL
jgi:hypothetical protein